jgi:hypothetical protein
LADEAASNELDARLARELEAAERLRAAGAWREAWRRLRRLQRSYPRHPALLAALGDCLAAGARWARAVAWYERALELSYNEALAARLEEARRQVEAARHLRAGWTLQAKLALAVAATLVLLVLVGVAMLMGRLPARPQTGPGRAPAAAVPRPGAATLPTTSITPPPPSWPLPAAPARTAMPSPPLSPVPPAPAAAAQPPPSFPPVKVTLMVEAPATDKDYFLSQLLSVLSWPDGSPLSGEAFAQFDPYWGHAFVTVTIPPGLSTPNLQQTVAETAYGIAAALFKADPEVRAVSVRALYAIRERRRRARIVVAFRATITRQAWEYWQRRGPAPARAQGWQELLQDVWWNPEVPSASR